MSGRMSTARLELMAATAESARAAANNDRTRFDELLKAEITPDWPPQFMDDAMTHVADALIRESQELYTTWFVILRKPRRTLIGVVGLKAPPDDGRVDIGYGIVDSYHERGYATEATQRMIARVFEDSRVRRIVAETLPHLTASMRVLDKCRFVPCAQDVVGFSGEQNVVQYELTRQRFEMKV